MVMKLFRERLLARLIERHAISEELARKLLAWQHPRFSAHIGEAIPFEDKKAIQDVACYVVSSPPPSRNSSKVSQLMPGPTTAQPWLEASYPGGLAATWSAFGGR